MISILASSPDELKSLLEKSKLINKISFGKAAMSGLVVYGFSNTDTDFM